MENRNQKEDNNVFYVTELKRLDSNYFKTEFATCASLIISLTACVGMVVYYMQSNQLLIPAPAITAVFGMVGNFFSGKGREIDEERKEIREKINNDEIRKSR